MSHCYRSHKYAHSPAYDRIRDWYEQDQISLGMQETTTSNTQPNATSMQSLQPVLLECYICRDETVPEIVMRQTCSCHALAHRSCIEKWVAINKSLDCPICRRSFKLNQRDQGRFCCKVCCSALCKKIAWTALIALFVPIFTATLFLSWFTGMFTSALLYAQGFLIFAKQCSEYIESASICILLQFVVGALVVYVVTFLSVIICSPFVFSICACIKLLVEKARARREGNNQPNVILVA